jgi:hypothetical protein
LVTEKSTKSSETFQRWNSNVKNPLTQSKFILTKNVKTGIEINNQLMYAIVYTQKIELKIKIPAVDFFIYSINL